MQPALKKMHCMFSSCAVMKPQSLCFVSIVVMCSLYQWLTSLTNIMSWSWCQCFGRWTNQLTKFYKILRKFTKIYAIIFLSSLLNSVVDTKTKKISTWCKTHWYYPYSQGNWRLQFSGCVRNWWFVVAFLYRNHTCVQSVNRDMPSFLQTQWEYGPQLSPWWKHPVEQCSTSIWKIDPKP